MLHSMTAYGRSSFQTDGFKVEAEIRSVNSRMFDVRLKYPPSLKDKEMEIRQMVSDAVERGKVDVIITYIGGEDLTDAPVIDRGLFAKYATEIKKLVADNQLPPGDITGYILRIPHVFVPANPAIGEIEWDLTSKAIREALLQFNQFREVEGAALAADLSHRIKEILRLADEVTPLENERIVKTRMRIRQNLNDFLESEQVDENRFEQEILFYLEKMDITEEKVRLAQHGLFFLAVLEDADKDKGRKLNFISQEIGREVNTLGAKAYDAGIQQIVVAMKNELEKIKEQLANIL